MKRTTKSNYCSPKIEFLCIRSDEDILAGSFNVGEDENQTDYGVLFPY